MSYNVLHFFPLIGGAYLGTEFLAKKGYDIENMPKAFSLTGAMKNEAPLIRNRGLDIEYYDETYADVQCDCITCNKESTDYDIECKKVEALIEGNKEYISTANAITSVPPCNSLCALNCSMKSRTGKGNRASQVMIRCAEFAVKSGVENFVFENAPALIGKGGKPLLEQIERLCHKYDYSMSLFKTNSKWHAQGQKRERSFVYLFKGRGNAKVICPNISAEDMRNVIGNIDADGNIGAPTTWQQEYLTDGPKKVTPFKHQYDNWEVFEKVYNHFGVDFGAKYGYMHEGLGKEVLDKRMDELIENYENIVDCRTEQMHKMVRHTAKTAKRANHKMRNGLGGYWGNEPIMCYDRFLDIYLSHGIIGKNFGRYVHPDYDRFLTFTEEARLMGIPDSFEIEEKEQYYISQNVPAFTFMRVIEQLLLPLQSNGNDLHMTKIMGRHEARVVSKDYDKVVELPF